MNKARGFIALLAASVILGTFGIWIRILAQSFSNTGQVMARSITALLFIIAIVLFKKINPFKLQKESIKYLLGFGVVFPFSILCFTISANMIKVSNSLFMLYVGSLFSTAVLGKLLFKEKFGLQKIVSLLLVIVGLLFFISPLSLQNLNAGILLGISAGLLEGCSHTFRKLMASLQREVVVFYQSFSSVLLSLVFVMVSKEEIIREVSVTGVLTALLFGALLVSIGYLLAYGFGNSDVNLGSIVLASELFFSLVINAVFLKEFPTQYELLGGSLIFLATILIGFEFKKLHGQTS